MVNGTDDLRELARTVMEERELSVDALAEVLDVRTDHLQMFLDARDEAAQTYKVSAALRRWLDEEDYIKEIRSETAAFVKDALQGTIEEAIAELCSYKVAIDDTHTFIGAKLMEGLPSTLYERACEALQALLFIRWCAQAELCEYQAEARRRNLKIVKEEE